MDFTIQSRVPNEVRDAMCRQLFIKRTADAMFARYGKQVDPSLEGHFAVWAGYEHLLDFKPEDI